MGSSYSARWWRSVDEETRVARDKVWVAHDAAGAEPSLGGQFRLGVAWARAAMSAEAGFKTVAFTANMLSPGRHPDSPRSILSIVETRSARPFGAKEAGEGSLAAFLPALTNAIADATGFRFNDLPVTPDRVFAALEKRARMESGSDPSRRRLTSTSGVEGEGSAPVRTGGA